MAELIRIFRENDPDLNLLDVRQAMKVAEADVRSEIGGAAVSTSLMVALLIGLAVAGLLFALVLYRTGMNSSILLCAAIAGIAAIVIVVAVIASRR